MFWFGTGTICLANKSMATLTMGERQEGKERTERRIREEQDNRLNAQTGNKLICIQKGKR